MATNERYLVRMSSRDKSFLNMTGMVLFHTKWNEAFELMLQHRLDVTMTIIGFFP
jgi:hypothetical protein